MELTRNSEFGIRSVVAGLALFCVLMMPATASACPGCKEALFDPGELSQKRATASGYALSIALMLSMPAVLVGGAAALLVRAHRRKRAVASRHPALPSATPSPQSVDSSPLSG